MSVRDKHISPEKQSRLPTSAAQSQSILIETDVVFEDEVGRVAISCAVARGAGARYEQGHLPCVLWVSYEWFCMVRLLVVSPSRLSLAIYSANTSSDCSSFVCRGSDRSPLIQGWRVLDQTCCVCAGVPNLLRVRLCFAALFLQLSRFTNEFTSLTSIAA